MKNGLVASLKIVIDKIRKQNNLSLHVKYESLDYLPTHTSLLPILRGFAPGIVSYIKRALDSYVIKFTSCLTMVGGFLRVLRVLPPLKLVAMIT
jgi:hypothetical protein